MKKVLVLGTGCPKCKALVNTTRMAVEREGIDATVDKIEDIMEIMKYGVLSTPALVVDGKVVLEGRIPSDEEIVKLLK